MVFITHAYYVLFFQGWGYLFANWKFSLPWVLIFTLLDFLLIQSAENAQEIWVYRFVPGIIAWAGGALMSEVVLKMRPFAFTGIQGDELLPANIFIEGIIYSLLILPIATCVAPVYAALLLVTCAIFIWMSYNFALHTKRFSVNDAISFYIMHWIPMLFVITIIPLIIISIFLDNGNQLDLSYFWTAFGIATGTFVYALFSELLASSKTKK